MLHLVDGTQSGIVQAYKTIRTELEAYGHALGDKPQIIALNKIDAIPKLPSPARRPRSKKPAAPKCFCSPA